MPTYEYECTHCGHNFELFQRITDKPIDKCPKCNKEVKRLIGAGSGIILRDTAKTEGSTCPKAKEGCDGCQNAK